MIARLLARLAALRRQRLSSARLRLFLAGIRASLVLLVLRLVLGADPGLALPTRVADVAAAASISVHAGLVVLIQVAVGAIGLVVLLWLGLEIVMAETAPKGRVAAQARATGASMGSRVLGLVGSALIAAVPVLGRSMVRVLAGVAWTVPATLLWIGWGRAGLATLRASWRSPTRRGLLGTLAAWAGYLRLKVEIGPAAGGSSPGTQRNKVMIRRVDGRLVENRQWRIGKNSPPQLEEHAELANALVAAYDASLYRPAPATATGRPDEGVERPGTYTIELSRTWATPADFRFVIQCRPNATGTRAASVGLGQLWPYLDHKTQWSEIEIKQQMLLSDTRLREDSGREGERGIFVSFARKNASAPEPEPVALDPDPVVAAIQVELQHRGLPPDFFRRAPDAGPTRSYDALTYRLTSGHRTGGRAEDYRASIQLWESLADAVRFHALPAIKGATGVSLSHDDAAHQFVIRLAMDPPPFPSGQATDLRRFITAHAARYARHPYAVCLGLTFEGRELWWNLADPTVPPHILYAGVTGSGKTISGPVSIALQLAASLPPDRLEIWLLDSPAKLEIDGLLGGLPNTVRSEVVTSGDIAIGFFTDLVALVNERKARAHGQDWKPAGPFPLVVVITEEWQATTASLSARDREEAEKAMEILAAASRAAGVRLLTLAQKADSSVLPTQISANHGIKAMARSRAEDYQTLLGTRSISIPAATPGRLAVGGLVGDEPIIVQGLYASKPTIAAVIADLRGRYPARATQAGTEHRDGEPMASEPMAPDRPPSVEPDDWNLRARQTPHPAAFSDDLGASEPREPTRAEASRLDRWAAARIISRWQADTLTWLKISKPTLNDRLRFLGFEGVRDQVLGSVLDELARIDVLVNDPDDRRFRRFVGLPWPEVVSRLLGPQPAPDPASEPTPEPTPGEVDASFEAARARDASEWVEDLEEGEAPDDGADPDDVAPDELGDDGDDDMPRRPTTGELADFAPRAAARICARAQAGNPDTDLTSERLAAYIRTFFGSRPPAPERIEAALGELADIGILATVGRHRWRWAGLGWSVAARALRNAGRWDA